MIKMKKIMVKLISPTPEIFDFNTNCFDCFWVAEKRVSTFQSAIIVEGFQSLGSTQPPKSLCVVPFPSQLCFLLPSLFPKRNFKRVLETSPVLDSTFEYLGCPHMLQSDLRAQFTLPHLQIKRPSHYSLGQQTAPHCPALRT